MSSVRARLASGSALLILSLSATLPALAQEAGDDAEVIKTVDDRPRYTGPPTYEWNDDDQYRDLEQKLLAQKRRAKLLAGRG